VNISAIDLNLLVAFDALMTERSVTRAAAKVGLSQPAFSNALARLRSHLDDRLFIRGRRAMIPTPRALELAPGIQRGLAQLRGAVERPEFRPDRSTTAFRVGSTDEIEVSLLPALLQHLRTCAPGVSINCSRLQGIFRVPEADLQSGALDVAIGAFPDEAPESGLFAEPLYDARWVSIARAGHPSVDKTLTLEQFCRLGHVTTFYPGSGPGLLDKLLARRGLSRTVVVSVPHFLSVPFLVARSDLIATVPDAVARMMARPLGLVCLQCPLAIPRRSVRLVWHTRTQDAAAHQWLRATILATARAVTRRRRRSTARCRSAARRPRAPCADRS
jgi:DNA-binding transcriptional LysR family regulator